MRVAFRIIPLFLMVLLPSCQKQEEEGPEKSVSVSVTLSSDAKVSLSEDTLAWENGDAVAVFNDANSAVARMEVDSEGNGEVSVPQVAKTLSVIYPYTETPTPCVPQYQKQKKGGAFHGADFPLTGSAPISMESPVQVQLSCAASCIAFKIEGLPSTRAVQHIKITFPSLDRNYAVSLEAAVFGDSDERIYLMLDRECWPQAQIDVYTDGEVYRLTTKGETSFDCTSADILKTSINPLTGQIVVSAPDGQLDITGTVGKFTGSFTEMSEEDESVDRIPDFSRVGYHYGDAPIPDYPVMATITPHSVSEALAAGTYKDTTGYIQAVIDSVGANGGGAVLLRNGTYNVSRTLFVDMDGVVLRGESRTETIIKNTKAAVCSIIYLGKSLSRRIASSGYPSIPTRSVSRIGCAVTEDYVPAGREYVRVENPGLFSAGEAVLIYRPKTIDWISDIGMDKIPEYKSTEEYDVIQWQYRKRDIYWERKIVSIDGDYLYLDAPIVMSLDKNYGGGSVYKLSYGRVSESGVENIGFDCCYDASITVDYGGGKRGGLQYTDENHAWDAIRIAAADNCWVRNVNSSHMAFGLAHIADNSIRITVEGCVSKDPVSLVQGGRRYAFEIAQAELCLVRDCSCDNDRHGCCASGHGNPGPNVYYNCVGTNMRDAMGVHMAWCTGTLLDNVITDGIIAVEDRGYSGNGHGWSGANTVFWNVEVGNDNSKSYVTCQSPWAAENSPTLAFHSPHASGRNYAVGVKGLRREYDQANVVDAKTHGYPDYYLDELGLQRPSGVWYPEVECGSVGSLHVSVFDETGKTFSWWPALSIQSSTKPLSLYQSQLEDRHARGIYLNQL